MILNGSHRAADCRPLISTVKVGSGLRFCQHSVFLRYEGVRAWELIVLQSRFRLLFNLTNWILIIVYLRGRRIAACSEVAAVRDYILNQNDRAFLCLEEGLILRNGI